MAKKIKKVFEYFKSFNFLTYFILALCALGLFRNIVFLKTFHPLGQNTDSIFIAMITLYFVQIALILMRQWVVWLISLIQVIFCIYVYPDFSFVPFIAVGKYMIFENIAQKGYGWAHFLNFAFISLGFSIEMIKTYLLYIYFPRSKNLTIKEAES